MESSKLFLPMNGRDYCVTLTEQKSLACRYGLSVEQVRSLVCGIDGSGVKTATKMKRLIDDTFRSSNATASGRVS